MKEEGLSWALGVVGSCDGGLGLMMGGSGCGGEYRTSFRVAKHCFSVVWGYEPDVWLAGLRVDVALFSRGGNEVCCWSGVILMSMHKISAHVFRVPTHSLIFFCLLSVFTTGNRINQ